MLSVINDELAQAKTRKKEFMEEIERIIPYNDEKINAGNGKNHRFGLRSSTSSVLSRDSSGSGEHGTEVCVSRPTN